MLDAGISWSDAGYAVEVVGDDEALPAARFGPERTADMIWYLGALRPRAVVIDSTVGILDGRMMAVGLNVYRADPGMLPERPAFGSVPARVLAEAARADLSALARLERSRGTQTGREADLDAGIAESAAAVEEMISAGRCVLHGSRDHKEVALSFDDGPHAPYTGQVLDVLARYGVPATFFCVGMNARAHREELTRMRVEGHAIGNHTWSHPFLPELTRPQLAEQIARTNDALADASGGVAPALFRPPYGSRNAEVVGWLAELVPTVVLWEVDPEDWAMPGARAIASRVLDAVRPGSIVVMHDGGGDRSQTVAALPLIVEGLADRGFELVSVDAIVRSVHAADASVSS